MTNHRDGDVRCHLSVDGVKVGKKYLVPRQSKRIKGVDSEDGLSYKPFKFGSLRTTGMRIFSLLSDVRGYMLIIHHR